jgi:hypothetical protein
LSGRTFSPREYVEHQMEMSEDEKAMRREFFAELFAQAEERE